MTHAPIDVDSYKLSPDGKKALLTFGVFTDCADLASIAARQPSVEWHALHLYDPQITSPGSVMPRFNYLFDELKADAASHRDSGIVKLAWVVDRRIGRAE